MDGLSGRVRLRSPRSKLLVLLTRWPGSRIRHARIGSAMFLSVSAHVVERSFDTVADLTISVLGDADTAWLGYAFKAGGDVDAVAEIRCHR